MNYSDIITTIAVITSILIAVATLIQNHRIIKASTQPKIMIYSESINTGDLLYYLVIKNFGASCARIEAIECDHNFCGCFKIPNDKNYINDLIGSILAPRQSKTLAMEYNKIPDELVTFIIRYSSQTDIYNEIIKLNLRAGVALPSSKSTQSINSQRDEIHNISYTLQEMLQKRL